MATAEPHAEVYRAIGRYLVEFSFLVARMRYAIERELVRDDPMVPRLALGEAFAGQITNAYFAICEQAADLDEEEAQVAIRLKAEVNETIKERNDIAHGDWEMEWDALGEARLLRTKPGRRAGAWIAKVKPVSELDALSDELALLSERVTEFGWLCFGVHPLTQYKNMQVRVRDIFRFQNRKALRKGRYADEPWFDDDDYDDDPSGSS